MRQKKVGIDVDALDQEQGGGLGRDGVSEVDPILEPLDPTGGIIPPENKRFLRRSSSYSRGDHPNSQQSPLLQQQ